MRILRKPISILTVIIASLVLSACVMPGRWESTQFSHVPMQVEQRVREVIATGMPTTFAIMDDGSLWTWGKPAGGQSNIVVYTPTKIMDNVISLCGTLVITSDYTLWNIHDYLREIGRATPDESIVPQIVRENVSEIFASDNAVITANGDLFLSGWHIDSEGNSVFDNRLVMRSARDITITGGRILVVTIDGSLWTWGNNAAGNLGDGTTESRPYSNPVKIMENVKYVTAYRSHTMVIRTDGTLWGWGENSRGQLGDGTRRRRNRPVRIMDAVSAVSISDSHTMAITNDGRLWAWGHNEHGELGDGTTTNRRRPVYIMNNVVGVSAGSTYTMAVTSDGSLWGWGRNNHGQLGIGSADGEFERTFGSFPNETAFFNPIKVLEFTP